MLSIIINVKNGEKYLAECLSSLEKFDDIVLLDNYSTDNTLKIAKSYPKVRVFQEEFTGMGNVRNLAASFALNEWVFFVDCDEIVSSELAETLLNTDFQNGCVYRILRKNYYDNKYIATSSWENDWILRLYNRREIEFAKNQVHDSFEKNNLKEIKLKGGHLYHFPYDKINQLIDKMQFYSTLYANQHFGRKKVRLYALPFRAFMMFIKCYILKQGFRDGYEGFIISCYNAMGVMSKYLKLYELSYKKHIVLRLQITHDDDLFRIIKQINAQLLLPNELELIFENEKLLEEHRSTFRNNLIIKHKLLLNTEVNPELNADKGSDTALILLPQDNSVLADSKLIKKCKHLALKASEHHYVKFIYKNS